MTTFLESRHELSMPNMFEGAKEVPLPLLWDLQVDHKLGSTNCQLANLAAALYNARRLTKPTAHKSN